MSELLEIIISAIDEASSVFDSIGQSAQDSGSTLQTAFEEATSEVERLEQELADIELGNIEGDFEAVSAQLVQAQAEADQLEQEFLEADQAASQMGDDLGIINSSMLMQLGEQVGNLGSQAEGMAQDMNRASISVGQLATQTGIAEPQMVNLINTISNATFPNEEAMLYVKGLSQMGVETSRLGESATNLDRINDAFGMGAPNVMSMSNELKVLGVDMNNVSSAFNALAYANANTSGGMETFTGFLRKFDVQFKELGFDVDQSAVIIAAASKKFGAGRPGFQGLSNALKECGGNVQELEKSLGLAPGTLENASAATGEYEGQLQDLANEEAEHKTLLDQIGAAWEDVSLSIGSIASPMMGVVGLFGQIGQFGLQVKGIKELVSTFKGLRTAVMEYEIVQNLASIATGVYGTIVGIVTGEIGLAEAATMAWNAVLAMNPVVWVIAALVALVAIIYEVGKAFGWWHDVGSMLEAIQAGVMKLWNAFINHPDVQAAIAAITSGLQWLAGAIGNAFNAILEFFGVSTGSEWDIVASIINFIGGVWDIFSGRIKFAIGVVQTIIGIFSGLYEVLSPIGSFLMEVFSPVFSGLAEIFGTIFTSLGSLIGAFQAFQDGQVSLPGLIMMVWNTLVSMFTTIMSTIVTMVFQFVDNLTGGALTAGKNFVTGIITYIRTLPGRIYTYLLQVWTRITTTATRWVTTARTKASQLVIGVITFLMTLPGRAFSALMGVVSKIISAGSQWISNAGSKAKGIVDAVKNKLASLPNVVYQEFMNIGPKIFQAGSDLANKAANAAKKIVDDFKRAAGINSPGYIQIAMVKEFSDMVDRVAEYENPAGKVAGKVASSIVKGFGKNPIEEEVAIDGITGKQFNIANGKYISNDSTTDNVDVNIKGDMDLNINLSGLPEGVSTSEVTSIFEDLFNDPTFKNNFMREIAKSAIFQNEDNKQKSKITAKNKRARGI